MSNVFNLPLTSLATGAHPIPQTAVAGGITKATLSLARCTTATPTIWPDPATGLEIQLEVSYDGGQTFVPGGGLTAVGGIATNRAGDEYPNVSAEWSYPQPPTHVRGSVIVTNGPLLTSATLSVS